MFTFYGMDVLLLLVYPILAVLVLIGMRSAKKTVDGFGFMRADQTKSMCGLIAICVILHHVSQQISDYKLFSRTNAHGLEPFFYTGFLCVAYFFYRSGFGLVKSYRTKENYLEGFGKRRVLPIAVVFVVTELIYMIIRARTSGISIPANPYSWYVFTLFLLYAFYYFAFSKLKRGRITCITILVALYIVFCRLFGFGEWWFNSVPTFVLGMIAAAREEKIVKTLEKKYIMCIVLSAGLFILSFAASRNSDALYSLWGGIIPYAVFREAVPLFQAVAAMCFCTFITAAGAKLHFGNKALSFLGNLSLEIYLLQGMFINVFGKYLFDGETRSPLYIRNSALYTLAVVAATILAAFLVNKMCSFITDFLGRAEYAKTLLKDAKKVLIAAGILAVVFIIFYGLSSRSESAKMQQKIDKYRDENITVVKAKETEIAAYVTGSGSETIVLLRGEHDPCPTLEYRPLADALAENYKVIVLDFPGQGFSGQPVGERTAENITEEIHSALHELGEDGPVILAASEMSGIYALYYINKYPDKVSAYIGIDAYIPELFEYYAPDPYSSEEEYTWALRRNANSQAVKFKLLNLIGYSRAEMSIYKTVFRNTSISRYTNEFVELYIRNNYNQAAVDEMGNMRINCLSAAEIDFPKDMPVLILLDNSFTRDSLGSDEHAKITVGKLYESSLTSDKQKIEILQNHYVIFYNPKAVSGVIHRYLDEAA